MPHPPDDLATPTGTIRLLHKFDFKIRKAIGQHFLVDRNILKKIIKSAELRESDAVLEIGAGIGTLTCALAENVASVIAVEYDRALIPILEEVLQGRPGVKLLRMDAMKLDLNALPSDYPQPNKVVANLPYQIAGPLISRLLDNYPKIESYTIMVQREVAHRLLAKGGGRDYGPLSLKIQFFCEATLLARVSPNVFLPRPKVYSALVKLDRRAKPPFAVNDTAFLFRVIRGAFRHRRKTLQNALSDGLNIDKTAVGSLLTRLAIGPGLRPEDVELEGFVKIAQALAESLDSK